MITNKDLLDYGREQEEKRLADRALFLRSRIRQIEDEMKAKLQIVSELRKELDTVQEKRGLKNQTKIFE